MVRACARSTADTPELQGAVRWSSAVARAARGRCRCANTAGSCTRLRPAPSFQNAHASTGSRRMRGKLRCCCPSTMTAPHRYFPPWTLAGSLGDSDSEPT